MNEANSPLRSLFNQAVEIADAAERTAFIDKACSENPALRQRVEVLLLAHEQAGGFLDEPAAPLTPKTIVLSLPLTEKPGDRIGPYKLLQQIGEGGCGVVYMAEQQTPVVRRVALKVIKLGMDSKSVIARFEAERQALAMMDHPNIAKVLDAGATNTGRRYFVMELVRGIKITEYCDQNRLSTADRLKLLVLVCHAIQHAHQKGIIHRDIKPSNILVTLHDGVPVPKVIDFGIAKATQGRLTDQTLFTAFEQFIGTPAYMSPEQAEMSGLDIDTRCDVYALGVLLYELLTGQTPFDARELIASGLDKMRQTIREKEPERPSLRLQTMLESDLTVTAGRCRAAAPDLIHTLRGDLDWIVMKALEKDRTRRFETATGLARDIQRYLANEPIEARPPSTLYRFQKLVRRNKLVVGAGAAVFAALVLGLTASLTLYVKERQARQRADAAEKVEASLRKQAEAAVVLEADKRQRAQLGEKIGTAALYVTQGKYGDAEKYMNQVPLASITNSPATAFLFNVFGEWNARSGRWPAALTDYANVTQIVPADFPAYAFLPPLCIQVGDENSYRKHFERALAKFADTTDPSTAARLAEACLILPPPAGQNEAITKLVDVAFAAGPTDPAWEDYQVVKALAEYRLGHFEKAVALVAKSDARNGHWNRRAQAVMIRAMAQFQLQQSGQARATLAEGLQTAARTMENVRTGLEKDWPEWLVAQHLMAEAQSLISPAPELKSAAK